MMPYIKTDIEGNITAWAEHEFKDSVFCPCAVVWYPDGKFYRTDNLPSVYAVPGYAKQQIGECPDGGVMMSGPRPEDVRDASGVVTETWVASQQGAWEKISTASSRLRAERDHRLAESTWIVERHRDQLASDEATTLTDEQYQAWLDYRQALRDVPQQPGFPWNGPDDPACPWPVIPTLNR